MEASGLGDLPRLARASDFRPGVNVARQASYQPSDSLGLTDEFRESGFVEIAESIRDNQFGLKFTCRTLGV
jgi:hypothetical protein